MDCFIVVVYMFQSMLSQNFLEEVFPKWGDVLKALYIKLRLVLIFNF